MTVSKVQIDDDYITVNSDDTIIEVAKAIAKAGVPDAVILDAENNVLGVLDDYDIVSKVLAEEKDPRVITAAEIMYAPPPVKLDTPLEKVHEILTQLEASMLPVVDESNKLLGVITIMDVLDGMMRNRGVVGWFKGLIGK